MLNQTGKMFVSDFLINNHKDGLKIIKDTEQLDMYVRVVEMNHENCGLPVLKLMPDSVSEGGCYLFTVPLQGVDQNEPFKKTIRF
jgi:hypothetical protein